MATDRELAAQSMMQAGIGSLSGNLVNEPFHPSGKEYRSFQTRSGNEPEAMAMERYAFDKARQGGNYPWNIDIDLKSDWSGVGSPYDPSLIRGNVFQSRSGNKSDINKLFHLDPKGDIQRFYNQKFVNQALAEGNVGNLTDAQRQKLMMMVIMNALSGDDKFIKQKDEDLKSGIMQDNLGEAKVMNVDWRESGPAEWLGKKTFPFMHKYFGNPLNKLLGFDETPSEFANPYLDDQGPPLDDEGNLLPGWELHQDGWHYFPPNEEDFGTSSPPDDKQFPLTMEASGDSYNIMAGELMRSGLFDPVEIQNMDSYELQQNYENTFGSTGDAMQMSLNLQDVMDLYKSKGLDLNTDRLIRRAKKAGVQVTNRGGIIGLL